mgnify:CR=1 FL=1
MNHLIKQHGLFLSDRAMEQLAIQRKELLLETGRIEFGEGILTKLIARFCDSPYMNQIEYEETLFALQELFYNYKNECQELLSDDELVDAMYLIYNDLSCGSTEYLYDISWEDMYRIGTTGSLEGTGLQRSPMVTVLYDEE